MENNNDSTLKIKKLSIDKSKSVIMSSPFSSPQTKSKTNDNFDNRKSKTKKVNPIEIAEKNSIK